MAKPMGQAQATGAGSAVTAVGSWTVEDSADLYRLAAWSDGFFGVNAAGHVVVTPDGAAGLAIEVRAVVDDVRARGIPLPVLIRFQDVLRARVRRLNEAFAAAIDEAGYGNVYRGVYPIKVNQLHEVVEEVIDAGRPYEMGLECGSKAELVATLAHLENDDTLLVCNGVKDAGMLRLILAAQSLGKNVIPVVEKYAEFEELLRLGDELAVKPRFGARVRLATSGAGRWQDSGGHRSKFGISTPELVALTGVLRERGMEEGFQLLHFHMGSQISDIQVLKRAVKELTQVYVQLFERGFPLRYLDVGGGLGVNYDTGYGPEDPGINYSLREYANAIVYVVKEVCDAGRAPHPVLVSESGRALTAHHSLLVVEVVGTYRKDSLPPDWQPSDTEQFDLKALAAIIRQLRSAAAGPPPLSELLEAYHDTVEIRREMDALFTLGFLRLEDKALAERLYWTACQAILEQLQRHELEPVPAEFVELEEQLIENTLCDFSVFQSMLDHWAIGQGFPIVPLQRLDERPDKRAVLVDLTCDSDGKVGHYVTSNPDKHFIELHSIADDESYLLGIFLMGAYQDIMGDTHNLFGRVGEAHVYADAEEPGNYYIEKVIPATRVGEMLAQVQYFPQDLERRMNELIRRKVEAGVIRPRAGIEMLERYQRCLTETTYYECEPSGAGER